MGFFRNKLNDWRHKVINKARLIMQEYTQFEEIDFEESLAFIAWLKAIRLLLAYDYYKDFKFFK